MREYHAIVGRSNPLLTPSRLRLTTHLFKEHLLEEDHYLDWVLRSLDSCSAERLFLWLLVVCIPDVWLSLISSRRRGKRLAESLLGHAEKVNCFLIFARSVHVLMSFFSCTVSENCKTPPFLLCLRTLSSSSSSPNQRASCFLKHGRNTELPCTLSPSDDPKRRLLAPSPTLT